MSLTSYINAELYFDKYTVDKETYSYLENKIKSLGINIDPYIGRISITWTLLRFSNCWLIHKWIMENCDVPEFTNKCEITLDTLELLLSHIEFTIKNRHKISNYENLCKLRATHSIPFIDEDDKYGDAYFEEMTYMQKELSPIIIQIKEFDCKQSGDCPIYYSLSLTYDANW